MTPERYQKILHWLNAHPTAKQLVILLNHWLPAVPFVCYPVLLVLLNLQWFQLLRVADERHRREPVVQQDDELLCRRVGVQPV